MAYNNYQFVADTTFNPLTLQEMMVPFTYYKEAYDKFEDTLADLSDKSDKFKYLSEELPEGSKAREIYEGYSNDLSNAARELWTKGLNAGNSIAFRSLRRRYSGEIGELERADEALKKEQDLRREMSLKDPSMLWAINSNDLNIDNFIGGRNKLNMYGISGKDLYSQAVQASKTASSRKSSFGEAGSVMDDYYRVLVQENGYNAESVAAFKESMDTIPELRDAVDGILLRNGVGENLSGADLEKARRWVIDGITDGMMYEAKYNPVQNLGKLTAAQAGELELGRARLAEEARHHQAEESNASTALQLQQSKDSREQRLYDAEFTSKYEDTGKKDSEGRKIYKIRDSWISSRADGSGDNSSASAYDKEVNKGSDSSWKTVGVAARRHRNHDGTGRYSFGKPGEDMSGWGTSATLTDTDFFGGDNFRGEANSNETALVLSQNEVKNLDRNVLKGLYTQLQRDGLGRVEMKKDAKGESYPTFVPNSENLIARFVKVVDSEKPNRGGYFIQVKQ